jgi:hypothetical protein
MEYDKDTAAAKGDWPHVAYPSAARLLKAMDGGLFAPQQVEEIVRLCPVQEICRLAVHPNG